jgi:hypothetical protein
VVGQHVREQLWVITFPRFVPLSMFHTRLFPHRRGSLPRVLTVGEKQLHRGPPHTAHVLTRARYETTNTAENKGIEVHKYAEQLVRSEARVGLGCAGSRIGQRFW